MRIDGDEREQREVRKTSTTVIESHAKSLRNSHNLHCDTSHVAATTWSIDRIETLTLIGSRY